MKWETTAAAAAASSERSGLNDKLIQSKISESQREVNYKKK